MFEVNVEAVLVNCRRSSPSPGSRRTPGGRRSEQVLATELPRTFALIEPGKSRGRHAPTRGTGRLLAADLNRCPGRRLRRVGPRRRTDAEEPTRRLPDARSVRPSERRRTPVGRRTRTRRRTVTRRSARHARPTRPRLHCRGRGTDQLSPGVAPLRGNRHARGSRPRRTRHVRSPRRRTSHPPSPTRARRSTRSTRTRRCAARSWLAPSCRQPPWQRWMAVCVSGGAEPRGRRLL